jgi:hypothetical protein
MSYRGKLDTTAQKQVDLLMREGHSGRDISKILGESYGRVRGYIEYTNASLTDLVFPDGFGPKMLVFDIETTPILGWAWRKWKTNIMEVQQDFYILCAAYHWYGEEETHFFAIWDDPNFSPGTTDDSYVVKRLHRLLDVADIVVAHNGDKFDIKKTNSRGAFHNLGPNSPYETIDTLKEYRKYLAETSNSQKDITSHFDLMKKENAGGLETWFGCMAGEPEACERMKKYNIRDVDGLVMMYEKIRPYMATHPNLGHYEFTDKPVCPKCGHDKLTVRSAKKRTKVSEFLVMQCKFCDGYSRMRIRVRQRTEADKVHLV